MTDKEIDPEIQALVTVACRFMAYVIKWLKKRYQVSDN